MENNQNNGFSYTYSAKEQAEIRKIREKYEKKKQAEESAMERLRRLDRSVTSLAQGIALTVGILGVLLLGFGMSLVMSELSVMLSLSAEAAMLWGVVLGLVGGVAAGLAYPVYNAVCKHRRNVLAPEILRLSDELLK